MSELTTILRPDERGEPDDFVISDVTMFRMERMDDDSWWIAVYRGDQRVSMFLNATPKPCRIDCYITEDGLGMADDGGNDIVNALVLEDAE